MNFEWSKEKERTNIQKHGVSFVEAESAFLDDCGFEIDDVSHSIFETRLYWVGKSKEGKILTTYFTRRKAKIRIIGSAEWRKFRRMYYERAKTRGS